MSQKSNQQFKVEDVRPHRSVDDIYIIVHDKVYDVTKFVEEHPGGSELLLDQGGADATEAYDEVGHSAEADEMLESLQIGILKREPGDMKMNKPHGSHYVAYGNQASTARLGNMIMMLVLVVILVGGLGVWLSLQP